LKSKKSEIRLRVKLRRDKRGKESIQDSGDRRKNRKTGMLTIEGWGRIICGKEELVLEF
jgi:hypothetical protein